MSDANVTDWLYSTTAGSYKRGLNHMLTLPGHSVKPNLLKPISNYRLIRLAAVCVQLATLLMSAAAATPVAANTPAIGLAAQPIKPTTAKTIAAPGTPAAAGDITGAVFNDYNDDGYRNLVSTPQFPSVDVGVPGIAVAAYNSAGTAVAATTTDANGLYTLTTGLAAGVPLRVEFTGYKRKTTSRACMARNNNSSVRFVATTDATIANIDFGIYKTQDYCQNNPRVAITRFVFDNNLTGQFNNQPSCYSFPYASTSTLSDTNKAARTVQTVGNQTGAVYGVAYHKPTRSVFLSAYCQARHQLWPWHRRQRPLRWHRHHLQTKPQHQRRCAIYRFRRGVERRCHRLRPAQALGLQPARQQRLVR